LTVEELREVARAAREEEHRRQLERAPQPQPRPTPSQGSPEWERRFPSQQVTIIRDRHEPAREFMILSPEETRLANALARIDQLERRVSQLEARNGGA